MPLCILRHQVTQLTTVADKNRARNTAHVLLSSLPKKGGVALLYYALVFLIVGLIAGVLGATGVAAIASQIAWILFIVGIILLVIHLATGRRGPVV